MTEKVTTVELYIPNILGYEKIPMAAAATVAKMLNFPPDRVANLITALSEACLNAIEHGAKGKRAARILVSLRISEKKLEVSVSNEGGTFKKDASKPDIKRKIQGNDPPRGWGMFLIKNLVDEVEFTTDRKKGNVTRMVIHIPATKQSTRSTNRSSSKAGAQEMAQERTEQ